MQYDFLESVLHEMSCITKQSTCNLIQSLRNLRDILEIVKAPKGMIPVAILALGWPAERPEPKPRRELAEIVHLNVYGNRMLIP